MVEEVATDVKGTKYYFLRFESIRAWRKALLPQNSNNRRELSSLIMILPPRLQDLIRYLIFMKFVWRNLILDYVIWSFCYIDKAYYHFQLQEVSKFKLSSSLHSYCSSTEISAHPSDIFCRRLFFFTLSDVNAWSLCWSLWRPPFR